jgi:hypothetical protein
MLNQRLQAFLIGGPFSIGEKNLNGPRTNKTQIIYKKNNTGVLISS